MDNFIILLMWTMMLTSGDAKNDGLYVTNGTDILYFEEVADGLSSAPKSVFHQENGRIVGLAIDIKDNLIFWSDISSAGLGIYRAALNDNSQLTVATKIVASDLVEVNGLALDWESKNVYWTDAKKRAIEVANYEGHHRRVLAITGLISPRGINVDPVSGFLFWTDQGQHTVCRSRPDGSHQEVIARDDVFLPNQLLAQQGKLYWVDSSDKDVWQSELDGSDRVHLGSVSSTTLSSNIFGLALDSKNGIYVGAWERGAVVSFSPLSEDDTRMITPYRLGTALFSLAYYSQRHSQTGASNVCAPARNLAGCSHLCLATGSQIGRCACPSYGGLTLSSDGKNCIAPEKVLLFALSQEGSIRYIAMDTNTDPDQYLVGRSLRPVAVTYDPVEQMVYWSDVHERRIHRAKFDGSQHDIFLDNDDAIGIVDGLALDSKNRKLYYANLGTLKSGSSTYSWHKIEVIDLDSKIIRTIVTDAQKPRGLFLDQGKLYYTEWGSNAKVVRTDLDGSHPVVIQTGLDNPNGLNVINDKVFVIDSHYKTRQQNNPGDAAVAGGTLGSLSGTDWQEWQLPNIMTPFGLTSDPETRQFYVSDWDSQSIVSLSLTDNGLGQMETVVGGVEAPMGVLYTQVSIPNTGERACDVSQNSCDDLCLSVGPTTEPVCVCSSYSARVLEEDLHTCQLPQEFILFADLNSIKLVGYDSADHTTYEVIKTNNLYNYVALAYDDARQGFYYSQVHNQNKRGIYFSKLDTSESQIVFEGNSIIDGLTFDPSENRLYWSDVLAGTIVSITTDGNMDSYKLVVMGLSSPRAVELDTMNGYLYWSECGTNPKIARISVNSGNPTSETIVTANVKQPNGLALDVQGRKLYIGDGFYNKIIVCDLEGQGCEDLHYLSGVPQHIFDVMKYGDFLYYSDWVKGVVTRVNLETGDIEDVAENLLRPTSIVAQYQSKLACPPGNTCSNQCIPTPEGYRCQCARGQTLGTDGQSCVQGLQWQEAGPGQCGAPCGEHEVCARQVGGSSPNYQCQCAAGYALRTLGVSQSCAACDVNKYKKAVGDDAQCTWCPQTGALTPRASSACVCSKGQYWDPSNNTCNGGKPGVCPATVPASVECRAEGRCSSDSDCRRAQKCCSLGSRCDISQCIDPHLQNKQCVDAGIVYDVGDTFRPDACSRCECQSMRGVAYATILCVVTECPVLACSPEHQTHKSGECCSTCDQTASSPNITITNCPEDQVITLTVREGSRWANHDFYIHPYDRTGLGRSLVVKKSPSGSYYEWAGTADTDVTKVTWTVTARRPSGGADLVTCSYVVKVVDPHPPEMSCPGNVLVYTSTTSSPVEWLLPSASDNIGVMVGYPRIAGGQPWGSEFTAGDHDVTYTVRDLASNQQQCTFKVTVDQLSNNAAKCAMHSPIHGQMKCLDTGGDVVACTLLCDEGYVRPPDLEEVYQFDCTNGRWTPALPSQYMVQSCIKLVPKTDHLTSTLVYPDCLPGIDTRAAELDLEDRVLAYIAQNPLLHAGGVRVQAQFMSVCIIAGDGQADDDGRTELRVTLTLSGQYQITKDDQGRCITYTELPDKFSEILELITSDSTPLVRADSMAMHIYDVPLRQVTESQRLSVSAVRETSQCARGQGTNNEQCGVCLICPSGTYQNGTRCVPCTDGSYQQEAGQTQCTPCKNGTLSRESAYTGMMCGQCTGDECPTERTLPVQSNPGISIVTIAIIVAVTAVVILVVIIVTVVLVRRSKRKHAQPESEAPTNSFSNPIFGDASLAVSQEAGGPASNNNRTPGKRVDMGSVRSTGSTSSAMARAYPDMPEKEIEMTIDDRGKVDLLKDC